MLTNDVIAETLEEVADKFESGRFGWMQNNFSDMLATSFCAIGALRYVYFQNNRNRIVASADGGKEVSVEAATIGGYLARSIGCPPGILNQDINFIPSWNDEPHRTKEDVIEAFKQAAKEIRNAA